MFDQIRNQLFSKQLYTDLGHKKRTIVAASNVLQNLGIVYTSSDQNQVNQINSFLEFAKKKRIHCSLLGYENKKRLKDEEIDYQKYFKNDLNWIGIPKASNIDDFCNQNFDLLLHLNPENYRHKIYILATSSAKIKAGIKYNAESQDFYDFQIEAGAKKEIELSDIYSQLEKLTTNV